MENFENFSTMWDEKGEMLKEIGCSERAAQAIWAWGIECGRAKNLQPIGSLPTAQIEKQVLADYEDWYMKKYGGGFAMINSYWIDLFIDGK